MEEIRRTLIGVALGQLVSFISAVAIFSASLITKQVDASLTLPISGYLVLAVVYGSILLYRRHKLMVPWYWYALIGFVDVHANYLLNTALRFTSITSVTLLDCWSIPFVMILTWMFFGAKYSLWQFVGAAICISGLGLVLLSDAGVGGGGGTNPLLGDFIVIVASLFYATSNVAEEFLVKRKDRTEFLTMIGVFGVIVSAPEIAVLERTAFVSIPWSTLLVLAYASVTVALFLYYSLTPFVLKMSGSTLFNLSILTSDMWVVAFRIFIYKQKVDWLFYVAFALVLFGICLYSQTVKDYSMQAVENADLGPEPDYHLIDGQQDCNPTNEYVHPG